MDSDDVASMLRARSGDEPPPAVVSFMSERAQGNPFFVEELFTYFGEQGRLFDSDGRWRRALDIEGEDVPDSVRLVVGRRLERVSENCRTVLTTAAVVGRTCTFGLLRQLAGMDDQALFVATDDAQQARLASSGTSGTEVTIAFAHELTRQTLLAGLSAPHRQHLHLQVANAIEEAAGDSVGEHAADIAHHLSGARSLADASRIVRFARIAAERAETANGWAEASRQYGVCLELLGEDADPETRAELLAARGPCAWLAGEAREAVASLREAIEQFSASGRHADAARAGLALLQIPSTPGRRIATAEQALALLGSDEPRLESLLTIARLRMRRLEQDAEERMEARLGELMAKHSFDDVKAEAALLGANRAFYASRPDQRAEFADEAHRRFTALDDDKGVAEAMVGRAGGLVQLGDLDGALAIWRELEAHARSAGLDSMAGTAARGQAGIHFARMERSEFQDALSRIPEDDFTGVLLAGALAEQSGDAGRALALLPPADAAAGVAAYEVVISGCRARVLHSFGRDQEAREALASWSGSLAEADGSVDALMSTDAAIRLADECLADLGTDEQVREGYEFVAACPLVRFTADSPGLDRLRGALALRLGRTEDARRHYREGLEWAERERCTIEAGRSLLGLARVERSGGDATAAQGYLERAASMFEEHGAELYLSHVRAEQEALSKETV
jgi:tetratricopeptide (TPR) repeat protein